MNYLSLWLAAVLVAGSFVACSSSGTDRSHQPVPPGSGGRGDTPGQAAHASDARS